MKSDSIDALPQDWGRDFFLRILLRELAGSLEEIVGIPDSEGFISVVGQRIGDLMNDHYRVDLETEQIPRKQLPEVLVDLKKRIEGDFFVVEETDEQIVLGNRRCPFGDLVHGRPSLCMMTSNVFGTIAAENLGYARVTLEETIARGDAGCRVVIDLVECEDPSPAESREYFGTIAPDDDE